MTQYPVLVYGTLRPGNHNYTYFLEGNTMHIEYGVRIPGFTMLAGPRDGFPFVVPGRTTDASIVADLVYIAPNIYDDVLKDLDLLEGYDATSPESGLYNRILVEFEVDGLKRQAYMYVAAEMVLPRISHIPEIVHGDWNKRFVTV